MIDLTKELFIITENKTSNKFIFQKKYNGYTVFIFKNLFSSQECYSVSFSENIYDFIENELKLELLNISVSYNEHSIRFKIEMFTEYSNFFIIKKHEDSYYIHRLTCELGTHVWNDIYCENNLLEVVKLDLVNNTRDLSYVYEKILISADDFISYESTINDVEIVNEIKHNLFKFYSNFSKPQILQDLINFIHC